MADRENGGRTKIFTFGIGDEINTGCDALATCENKCLKNLLNSAAISYLVKPNDSKSK
jgi:hypothetical protein